MTKNVKLNLMLEYLNLHRTGWINYIILSDYVPEINKEESEALAKRLFKNGYITYTPVVQGKGAMIKLTEEGITFWMKGGYSLSESSEKTTQREIKRDVTIKISGLIIAAITLIAYIIFNILKYLLT